MPVHNIISQIVVQEYSVIWKRILRSNQSGKCLVKIKLVYFIAEIFRTFNILTYIVILQEQTQ